ncbi:glycine cleavage system aminomethyltransferase GcvT [Haloarculaceae archaeon H-GB2-1]|nr:glycine cleavage system aminomethyltransferase GcvT [Haloarculaceae archaeon H-GB1-1]MEA5387944.1 glycine cleavage system aminomethyltransferase GcvT [Haloarculaceae archaeon H-GB11]MEA5409436.1 glycine cleavage system aminomethyltransferase GcvT [Haloarculaceae archaeon H-GB2-1]
MSLRKPPLYEAHAESGADFTDFGGWEMPVSFSSIRDEHAAVRDSVGLFDVSHMGELSVDGPDATELLHRLTPSDVEGLGDGRALYSCLLRDDGVILDDVIVYDHPTESEYVLVPNAGHDEEMLARLREHKLRWDLDVDLSNKTKETGMVAVQGPDAVERVDAVTADDVTELDPFEALETTIDGVTCLVARTGYTGEDGFEIMFPSEGSDAIEAAFADIQRCGLGARDTLRLEAGLLLSGQDFHSEDEPHDPFETGIGFVVDLDSGDFVGKPALERAVEDGPNEKLVGIRLDERAIARHGHPIVDDGEAIGTVTSGTMSPTLGVPIAMGYVDADFAATGTELTLSIRGRDVDATVVDTPFLDSVDAE